MLRAPLNVIPTFIVQILQTMVSVSRIDTFLNEPEVDDQVSTLKKPASSPSDEGASEPSPLGFKHASFKWNAVEEKKDEKDTDKKDKKKANHGKNGTIEGLPEISVDAGASAEGEGGEAADEERQFELQDLDVVFPDGELTVVTGPTASGKTALLVRSLYALSHDVN